jgi:predicted PurR-regulated permease PerM
MGRSLPLLLLIAAALLVGAFFVRIIWPLVFPLFFAGILAVLFRPAHLGMVRLCRGHRRIAAALTTLAVFLLLMLPLTGVLLLAGMELVDVGRDVVVLVDSLRTPAEHEGTGTAADVGERSPDSLPARLSDYVNRSLMPYLAPAELEQLEDLATSAIPALTRAIYERTRSLFGEVVSLTVGVVITLLGLYYLLADGDKLAALVERLSPLERDDQRILFEQFENVCRGVVIGTVAAGLVQGTLAGLGFAILGVDRIWLLAVLTMSASLIPFVGAATIWIVVAIGLVLEERYVAAGLLTVYGTVVISQSDNLIRAYIIGNRAQMHPFIVLVTVLGAIQFVGLWGVFLGPITAAFFYSLVNILHQKFAPPATETEHTPEAPEASTGPDIDAAHADDDPETSRPRSESDTPAMPAGGDP